MKKAGRKSAQNIYEYLDPLSCTGDAYDEEKTSAAIKSMMGVQKREQKKNMLPELTPIEEPEVAQADPPAPDAAHPEAQARPETREDIARSYRRIFSAIVNKWWLVALVLAVVFHEIVLAAAIIAAILTLLLMTLFGPEALLDSVARDWRKHTSPTRATVHRLLGVTDRLRTMAKTGAAGLAARIARMTRRSASD